ncbi:MAG: biotin--[acetyl-CoA-carboxylase] ligase [Dysgonamonadaceae bacterium]|jgi:BirA family biotin operon repressor/biotin-[acetyl-CoA-carboxylase] ligase|nr:biotin--[acetyl-CoA-carboxylase] ligase [Dysgonamonadaceae bacterium]
MNIIKIDSVNSTNSELKKLCSEQRLPSFSTIVAGKQTAGRGQAGNFWESEPYKNLTFSVVLFPENLPAKQSFIISRIFSLAVKETLDKYTGHISIKWPNDIYYQDKKICGILIENEIIGNNISSSIIGIGLNINQELFISDAPNPISLRQITNKTYHLNDFLDSILKIAEEKYQQFLSGNIEIICNEYQNALYRKSGYYAYEDKNGRFQACIKEVKDDGTLILETGDKEIKHYQFKEVRFI